jgi:hypothetical protein
MNIPRYWARATGETERPDGSPYKLTAWGWSAESDAAARRAAEDRLSRMLARVESGEPLPNRYPYGVRALREEIVGHIARGAAAGGMGDGPDLEGAAAPAIITRNCHGCSVILCPQSGSSVAMISSAERQSR